MTYVIALSWDGIQQWMLTWLPLIFMGLIAVVLVWMLRFMPRTKPQEIKPDSKAATTWDDVAGADEAKEELREIVDFLRDPKRFRKLGASVPKGVLLHGPPGTGKTLLAKAAANEANAKFFAQSAASFVEMFVGLGAARIRRLFRMARKARPAIIFIDELDAVGATRGNDISGEKDQTLNQLLVEMDGFERQRRGRRDRRVQPDREARPGAAAAGPLRPPDLRGAARHGRAARRSSRCTRRTSRCGDVDLELVARQTAGLTGADLANICNEAAIFAGRAGRDEILIQDFQAALERVVAGMESRRVMTDHEKRIIAYHEAGHALCRELLPSVEKLHKVSIVPRGHALGYAMSLPEEDRYLKSKEELTRAPRRRARRPRRRADRLRIGHDGRLRTTSRWPTRSAARWSPSSAWATR